MRAIATDGVALVWSVGMCLSDCSENQLLVNGADEIFLNIDPESLIQSDYSATNFKIEIEIERSVHIN